MADRAGTDNPDRDLTSGPSASASCWRRASSLIRERGDASGRRSRAPAHWSGRFPLGPVAGECRRRARARAARGRWSCRPALNIGYEHVFASDRGRSDGTRPLELLEREITALASEIHAATCRWLELVAEYDAREGWAQWGMRSCAQWVSWQCGITPGPAREHVRVARRLGGLPLIRAAFAAGELSYSKVRALTRVENVEREQELLDLARHATGSQLERCARLSRRGGGRAGGRRRAGRAVARDRARGRWQCAAAWAVAGRGGGAGGGGAGGGADWLAEQDVPAGTPEQGERPADGERAFPRERARRARSAEVVGDVPAGTCGGSAVADAGRSRGNARGQRRCGARRCSAGDRRRVPGRRRRARAPPHRGRPLPGARARRRRRAGRRQRRRSLRARSMARRWRPRPRAGWPVTRRSCG